MADIDENEQDTQAEAHVEVETVPPVKSLTQKQLPSTGQEPELGIAAATIPYAMDDSKGIFLRYRACGFSTREALQLTGIHKSTLSWYRSSDPKFLAIEEDLPNIRKVLARDYTQLDYYRNFTMILELDGRVLRRSLGLEHDAYNQVVPMTIGDTEYLLKMRAYYTPQHLAALESITKAGEGGFNFAQFISAQGDLLEVSRTDTIKMRKQ